MSDPAVLMYTTDWCGYCHRARTLFAFKGVAFTDINVDTVPGAREQMHARSGRTSVPQIFIGGHHIGGFDDTKALDEQGKLDSLLAGTAGV